MAIRLEIGVDKQTTHELETARPTEVGSGLLGAGLVVLAAGLAVGTYLMIGVVSSVPGTLRGQWECRALERNAAVLTACLSKFDPRMTVDGVVQNNSLIME